MDRQISLSFGSSHEPTVLSAPARPRPVRLVLMLDHRSWLELLADEWWMPRSPSMPIRLGVGVPRGGPGPEERSGVAAWIDPTQLPQIEVFCWRGQRWSRVPLAEVGELDEEVAWPGPVPLFAVKAFSVANPSDEARLLAMARGFANVAPPAQPLRVEPLELRPLSFEPPPEQQEWLLPRDWNANRGAAAMAVWSVPTVAPWLDVLCESLDLSAEGAAATRLGAAWWKEPPWRAARAGEEETQDSVFWRAIVGVLREVRLREAWRPLDVLDAIRERAISHGLAQPALDDLMTETRSLLNDEHQVSLKRSRVDPIGLTLQLVLLRPTPGRFITWAHELQALPPVIWWTGAMLSGLIQGYRDLDQRFRGLWEGRRLLTLRTWQHSLADSARAAWPGLTSAKPTWRREAGKVRLLWGDEPWAERPEHTRGRWFAADFKRSGIRMAAIDVARRLQPACLRRRVLLTGARMPVSGAGRVKVEAGPATHLLVEGTVELELPPQAALVTDLDEESFRTWLVREGIAERLPEPPSEEPVLAVADAPMADVPGLIVVPDFVSELEEKELIAAVDAAPWRSDLKRRVQHYGWRYDYQAKRVDPSARLGPLPDWAGQLGRRLVERGLLAELPDQVIVNEYKGKQGIARHVDCLECFHGPIVTLSLGESWEMIFWGPLGQKVVHMLARRSAVVLSGEAREQWKHEIPKRMKEPWGYRGRRISLTFRKVVVARDG